MEEKSMKRIISLILLAAVMVGVFGTACGGEWADYSDGIVNNAETVIGDLREECARNGGKLEKERIELFYRFYQLWISAKQVWAMASVDYHTIVIMDKMDPYATSQKVAAETWGKYLSGEVDAEKIVQVLIALTDEIGK